MTPWIGGFVSSQPSTQKKWDSSFVRLKVASTWSVNGSSPLPGNSHDGLFLAVCKFRVWRDGLLAFAAFCRRSLQPAGLLLLPFPGHMRNFCDRQLGNRLLANEKQGNGPRSCAYWCMKQTKADIGQRRPQFRDARLKATVLRNCWKICVRQLWVVNLSMFGAFLFRMPIRS